MNVRIVLRPTRTAPRRSRALAVCGILAAGVAAAGAAALAAATPPALLNYQGVLRDANNRPVEGDVGMVFRFFDASTGGNEILVDRHTALGSLVHADGGVFTVQLGGGAVSDGAAVLPGDPYLDLAAVFRDFAAVYMDVEVQGERLTPRVRIVASAYALNADELDGRHAAEFVDTSASAQVKAGSLRVQHDVTVDGTLQVTGGLPGEGRVLTSDAAGRATWQDLPGRASGGITTLAEALAETGTALPALQPQPLACDAGTAVTFTAGGAAQGRVTGFAGDERVSAPFAFHVAVARSTALDLASVLERAARLTVDRGGRRTTFSGVVARAELAAQTGGGELTYVYVVEPTASVLDRTVDYAIYQDATVVDVVTDLLDAASVPYETVLRDTYERAPMRVRFAEAGLDFAGRLAEAEGLHYWFAESSGGDRLVLGDANEAFQDLATTYTYYGHLEGPADGREYVRSFRAADRRVTRKHLARGYDFTRPSLVIEGNTLLATGVGEAHRYDPGLTSSAAATRLSHLAAEREEARERAGSGTSNVPDLRAGRVFTLRDRVSGAFDGAYLVTATSHLLTYDDGTRCWYYANRFTTLPFETTYRPPLAAPWPRAVGPVTAVVTGPAGAVTYKDPHDRVKVRFKWDHLSPSNETSSAWVRVLLPGNGVHSGAHYVPRVGDEVLVDFLHDDPSQPVVVGAHFDGVNVPPP